jgi:hypothetical protein
MLDTLYTGLRNKLLASSGLTALVSQRVYKKASAQNATYPYVCYYISAGGAENVVLQTLLNVLVTVEAWGENDKQASDVFEQVWTALHYETLTLAAGWDNFWMAGERVYDLPPELYQGRTLYRVAADFRVRVQET